MYCKHSYFIVGKTLYLSYNSGEGEGDMIQKILSSDIVYNVWMPIIILVLNWWKSKSDINKKNRELGYWKLKYEKQFGFDDISIRFMIYYLISLIGIQVIRAFFVDMMGYIFSYIIAYGVYLLINACIVLYNINTTKVRIELLCNKKRKIRSIIFMYMIFAIVFHVEIIKYMADIIFVILFFLWMMDLYKIADIVLVLEKSYADIYVTGVEPIKEVSAGSMKKMESGCLSTDILMVRMKK